MLDLINRLLDIQGRLVAETPTAFIRQAHTQIDWNNRLIGIVGPRGVGKTTLLLQHIKLHNDSVLYLSADSVLLGSSSLFDLAQIFHLQRGGKVLYIDEVHKCKNWSIELKTIYDAFPRLKVVFTGSSQINILKSKADLARRAALYTVPGLSFREYLELEVQIKTPVLKLPHLLANHEEISASLSKNEKLLLYFQNYLSRGYYPYYREIVDEADYFRRLLNSIDKTIFEDISLVANLQTENLIVFKELLAFFSSIPLGELNVHKLAKNLGKKDDTIKSYLQIMHDTNLLRILPNSLAGHAKLKAAQKVFFDNTNILNAFCFYTGKAPEKGLMRETFVIEQLQSAGLIPLYSKIGDIKVGDVCFEIGGPKKGKSQLKGANNAYVLSDEIIVGIAERVPLYLLGLLY